MTVIWFNGTFVSSRFICSLFINTVVFLLRGCGFEQPDAAVSLVSSVGGEQALQCRCWAGSGSQDMSFGMDSGAGPGKVCRVQQHLPWSGHPELSWQGPPSSCWVSCPLGLGGRFLGATGHAATSIHPASMLCLWGGLRLLSEVGLLGASRGPFPQALEPLRALRETQNSTFFFCQFL